MSVKRGKMRVCKTCEYRYFGTRNRMWIYQDYYCGAPDRKCKVK